jgi:hypothetical protein
MAQRSRCVGGGNAALPCSPASGSRIGNNSVLNNSVLSAVSLDTLVNQHIIDCCPKAS